MSNPDEGNATLPSSDGSGEDCKIGSKIRKFWQPALIALSLFWVACSVGLLVQLAMSGKGLINPTSPEQTVDFTWLYAASLLASGQGGQNLTFYNSEILTATVRQICAPLSAVGPYYLQYPPYVYVLLKPFTLLPITSAWAVWVSLQFLLTLPRQ